VNGTHGYHAVSGPHTHIIPIRVKKKIGFENGVRLFEIAQTISWLNYPNEKITF
jgi:hypothetical protein